MTTSEKIKAQRLKIQLQGDPVEAVKVFANGLCKITDNEARVERVDKDELGFTHVYLGHYYKGIPVEESKMIYHITGNNVLYDVTGKFVDDINLSNENKFTPDEAKQKALEDISWTECLDNECREWKTKEITTGALDNVSKLDIIKDPILTIYNGVDSHDASCNFPMFFRG